MAAFFNDQQSQCHQRHPFSLDSASYYYPPVPNFSSCSTAPVEIPQQQVDLVPTNHSPTSSTISASSASSHHVSWGIPQIEQDDISCSLSSCNKKLAERLTMYRNRKTPKEGRRTERQKSRSSSNNGNAVMGEEPEPPSGYVHVRARRGQATDSHSLAERVRREKISRRMKMLQSLVPGCDKLTGKALVLDEIINYIQSLQNQVELLSMKLSSLEPMMCDYTQMFTSDNNLDTQMKVENVPQPPFLQPTASNYPCINMDHSLQFPQHGLLGQHGALPELPQSDANYEMLMDGIHEGQLTAVELENICAPLY